MSGSSLCKVRVLVTGATGFLGRHLCRRLIGYGAEVHSTTRTGSIRPETSGTEDLGTIWRLDLVDPEATLSMVNTVKPDIIFHLAGHAAAKLELVEVHNCLRDDLTVAVNVLTAAVEAQCQRVVLPGSLEEPTSFGEAAVSPYAWSKQSIQGAAAMFRQVYNLDVVSGKVFMTYGPGQDAAKLIPSIIDDLLSGQNPVLNSPHRYLDWIYVDDVVDGLIRLAVVDDLAISSVDLGTGQLTSIKHIAELLCQIDARGRTPVFRSNQARGYERAAADVGHQSLIKWKPNLSLEDGLQRTYRLQKALSARA